MSELNPVIIKMSAVSSCWLLLQPYWTIQNDNLACGSNSDWTGPSLTEGWHVLQGSCVFCQRQHFFLKPSFILYTIYFSRAPFIHTAHFTQRVNHCLPREREGSLGEDLESRPRHWWEQEKGGMRDEIVAGPKMRYIGRYRWEKGMTLYMGEETIESSAKPGPKPCTLQLFTLSLQFLEALSQVLLLRSGNYIAPSSEIQKLNNSGMTLINNQKWQMLGLRKLR